MISRRTRLDVEPLEGRTLLSGLSYSLTTNQATYIPGQPVEMTFQETNNSSQPISVQDGPSIDGFTVTQGGSEVWRSNGGVNPLFIMLEPLQPGQSLTLTATWNGIPTGSSTPATGRFAITNQLNPQAASATVTISNSSSSPAPVGQDPPTGTIGRPTSSPTHRDPNSTPTPAVPPLGSSPIDLTVTTNHSTFRNGHPVRLTAILHNTGRRPADLTPDSYVDGFNVLDGSTEVWHAARTAPRRLKPGQSIKITAVWNGRLATAAAATAPGTYTIEAIESHESASTTIRLMA